MSVAIAVANAVVDVINFSSLGVEAERWYVPNFDVVKDLNEVRVSVVPRAITVEPLSRKTEDFTYSVDIAIQQKMQNGASASNDEIKLFCDPLMELMEQIIDLFRGKSLTEVPGAQCMGVENPFVYAPDHLEMLVFTSICTLHFKLDRNRP